MKLFRFLLFYENAFYKSLLIISTLHQHCKVRTVLMQKSVHQT